jgi:hypothetical protein
VTTPAGYVQSLERDPALAVTPPRGITIGGLSGLVVDVRLRATWKKPCPWSNGAPAALALIGVPPASRGVAHNVTPLPMAMRLYLLAYKGGTLGVEVDAVNGPAKLAAYDRVVRSFTFHVD